MIRCPQCGFENALGHIFCARCRSKLDIQELSSKDWSEPEAPPKTGCGRLAIWLALYAVVISGFALALWPMPLEGRKCTEADARQARRKILLLENGLSPTAQSFSERELNAYLEFLLSAADLPGRRRGGWSIVPQAAEVSIRPHAVTILMVSVWGPVTIGSRKLGPWKVTGQVTVVPEKAPDVAGLQQAKVRWTIKRGRIGRLPLPGAISAPAAVVLRPLLEACFRERVLLANATQVELEEGRVAVAVKTRGWKSP